MKRLTFVAALAVLAATVAPVHAGLTLGLDYTGPITMNIRNFDESTLYLIGDGPPVRGIDALNGLQQVSPTGGFINRVQSDGWGIVRIENILTGDGSDRVLWQNGTNGQQITGIFWGLQDTYIDQTSNAQTGTVVQNIRGVDVQAAYFLEVDNDWPGNSLGPSAWDNTTGPVDGGGNRGPVYPNVTDGQLLWTFRSAPGITLADITDHFVSQFTQSTTGFDSTGAALFNLAPVDGWGEGSDNAMFAQGMVPAWQTGDTVLTGPTGRVDMRIDFDGTSDFSGDWLLRTSDPMEMYLVPEPGTLGLVAVALVGLAARRRRRA